MIEIKEVKDLMYQTKECAVSIYIPTYRAGHNQEDNLRFKNAINEVKERLIVEWSMEPKEAGKYLRPAYELLFKEKFWMHLSDGLVVFIADDVFKYFICPVRFEYFVHVSNKFYLRPLIGQSDKNTRFFLLALSQNEVRFFDCTQHSVTPVLIEDLVPQSLELALANDDAGRQNLQYYSGSRGTIYHGYGTGKDNRNKDLTQYFRWVDKGIMKMLYDETAPMIMATVNFEASIYQKINQYPNLIEHHINGNPENDDPVLLHEKAWPIMEDWFAKQRNEREIFQQLAREHKASTTLSDIVIASYDGKVKTIYLNKDRKIWGSFNPESRSIDLVPTRHVDVEDLLELCARYTFGNGGKVLQVKQEDLPLNGANAGAIFRY